MKTSDLRLGIDFDEPIYPWHSRAHDVATQAGITGDCTRSFTWFPWEEYGCTKGEWVAALTEATLDGYLYSAAPNEGAVEALQQLADVGAQIFLITARGNGRLPNADVIRQHTHDYIDRWNIPHHGVYFTRDKGTVARQLKVTHAIDDNLENYLAFVGAGAITYLLDTPWNMVPGFPVRRVNSLSEFAEQILVKV